MYRCVDTVSWLLQGFPGAGREDSLGGVAASPGSSSRGADEAPHTAVFDTQFINHKQTNTKTDKTNTKTSNNKKELKAVAPFF